MKIAMIGDIVGRPGRVMVREHLPRLKKEHGIDFVTANYENASHGFGLTPKNAEELFGSGIDMMTGGNHSFDKKEIVPLLDSLPLLRPHNYPEAMPGSGVGVYETSAGELGVVNVMGHYGMPMVDNPFTCALKAVEDLKAQGVHRIVIDFHAEASSEKRAMLMMLRGEVGAIVGTHTHVATDDLQVDGGTGYIGDIGLSGCRDNVIGMDAKIPLQRFLTGMPGHFDVPKKCKKVLQLVIFELGGDGRCVSAKKVRVFDDGREWVGEGWIEA